MLTSSEAIHIVLKNTLETTKVETKKILESKQFSLAEKIITDRPYPPFPRATMDGYALRIHDLYNTKEFNIIGEVYAGDNQVYPETIISNAAVKIMTGSVVPKGFDAIIKIEDTLTTGNKVKINLEKFSQGMNIAKQGEDANQGDIVAEPGSIIDDSLITVAASLGYAQVKVFSPPSISLISTGNEIVAEGVIPLAHQIRDSNLFTIRSMLNKFHAHEIHAWNLPDDPKVLAQRILECFDSDICIITGGVSAGDADYIPSTLKSLGVQEIFHKVLIRPGKPIWFGRKDKTLFFGLPGNPISARVTFKIFVEPCIRKYLHMPGEKVYFFPLFEHRKKKHHMEEYFRAKIVDVDDKSCIKEIPNNGSGDFIGSLNSEGIAIHPADTFELPKSSFVRFLFW